MRITWTAGSVFALSAVMLLALGAIILYFNRGALARGAAQAASLVNPADSRNVVNRAITSGVTAAVGREETLGGFLHDIFGSASGKIEDMKRGSQPSNPLPGGYDEFTVSP